MSRNRVSRGSRMPRLIPRSGAICARALLASVTAFNGVPVGTFSKKERL